MHKLVQGIHDFQANAFSSQRELFERLAEGQQPDALFITCSDSRIDPNLITQTAPGELFILRNAGNIVPPHGITTGGEQATIEFAVVGLGIRDIIVCGHTHCGAVEAALAIDDVRESMPRLHAWLIHAETTRQIVRQKYANLRDSRLLNVAIQENVLVQLENLRTHPAVGAALARDALKLHGWVYKFETGQVFGYDPQHGQFLEIGQTAVGSPIASTRPLSPQLQVI
jgi:carbonic anhydrase